MERIDLPDRKYRTRMHFCQKHNCQSCRQGTGHGPYWYAYERVNGRVVQRYLGKTLPDDLQQETARPLSPFASLPACAEPHLRLRTLGPFRLEHWKGAWEPLTHTALPHARRLLGYLLTCPQRSAPRAQVLEALWPAHTPSDASLLLRKAVHTLASLLIGTPHERLEAYFQIRDECLYLAGQDRLWVDADAFESLLALAEDATSDEQDRYLLEAASLYQGVFCSEERQAAWAATRRQALHHAWTRLMLELATRALTRGDTSEAITSLQRLLAADPLHEPAVERLMTILIALDRRSEALRLYARFAALQKEAGMDGAQALLARVQDAPTLKIAHAEEKERLVTALPAPETPPVSPQRRLHVGPLVGRTRELAELRAILQRVEAPQSPQKRLFCLTGEAGIGKTRLVEELLSDVRAQGWNTVWGRVYAEERRLPYRLWTGVLQSLLEQLPWPWLDICRRPTVFRPLIALLPALAERLPPMEQAAPEQEERLLWEAVHELLILLSAQRPLLIVLDDLHWADSGSGHLLAYLLRHLHPTILLLATCRAQELDEHHLLSGALAEGEREGTTTMLALRPLEDEAIRSLIEQQVHLSPGHVQAIALRSGGNPFFAEELARQAQTERISPEGTEGINGSQLPETIQAVLALRLSRLSAPCQRLLGKAAVLGHSFTLSVIAAMEAQGTGGVQEEALLDLLDEALLAGLLSEEGTAMSIVYQFWHPLLVSHLLGELSAARRARYHQQAVHALKQVYQGAREEEQAATIVHHLLESGAEARELAYYAERAGDYAYRLSVYPEATYYYSQALQHFSAHTPAEQRVSLLEHLGECQMIQGTYAEARQSYEQALSAVERWTSLAQGNEEQARYRAQRQALLWSEIGWTWRYLGEPARAHECRRAGEQLLQRAGLVDGPAWASLRYQQSNLSWQDGQYQEALVAAQESLALFERSIAGSHQTVSTTTRPSTRIERTLGGDLINLGRTLTLLANIALTVGKSADAIAFFKRALAIFEAQHCLREVAIVNGNLGDVYLRMAQHHEAQAALERSLEVARRMGDIPVMCVDNGNLGLLADRLGTRDQAEAYVQQALEQAQLIGDAVYISLCAAFLAGILSKQRKCREAISALRSAFAQGRDFSPCRARAFITLSKMRVEYSVGAALPAKQSVSLLNAAYKTIERVLQESGLEAELHVEGQLLLAQISFLRQRDVAARQIACKALKEAEQYELHWLAEQLRALVQNDKG